MSESREGFKLLGKHRDGCYAAARPPAFIVHDEIDFHRKKNGDKGGSTMWHRFICNDTRCHAVMLVRWDVLAQFIDAAPLEETEKP